MAEQTISANTDMLAVGDTLTISGMFQVSKRFWQFGKPRPFAMRWWQALQFWRPWTTDELQRFTITEKRGYDFTLK